MLGTLPEIAILGTSLCMIAVGSALYYGRSRVLLRETSSKQQHSEGVAGTLFAHIVLLGSYLVFFTAIIWVVQWLEWAKEIAPLKSAFIIWIIVCSGLMVQRGYEWVEWSRIAFSALLYLVVIIGGVGLISYWP